MSAVFTELHACSAFSFLLGASQPEAMVRRAAELGYDSLAITDHAGFYASARAHHAAKECGIRAIVGCVLDLPDGSRFPVLCATRDGYRMMSRHLTDRNLAPEVAQSLRPTDGHLIALTGDRSGPVCQRLLKNDKPGALSAAQLMVEMFGRQNLYVELIRQGLRDDGRLNRHLVDLARHLKLPVLASNAPLHARRGDRCLADAFTCLRHHVPLDEAGKLLARNSERHLKSPRQMAALFADLPEAIVNSRRLAERIGFTLENLDYRFPDFPDGRGNPLSMTEQTTLLRRQAYAGASRRYGVCNEDVRKQLEHELAMIHRLGFSGYFLIVNDLVEFARGRGILCQGRGSAANSVVCYALGITAVDPVGGKLLFERFLSENRKSWPDIDIDFPSGERREEVIQHVFKKYGQRGAAMTANVITYRGKLAFREMSKVLGFPPSVAERFSGTPSAFKGEGSKSRSKEEREDEFEERISSILPPSHPRLAALAHLYHAALGMPRHLGQHPGGIIVCDHGLDSSVPLQPATMVGRNIVQWDKDDCEDMGIVKIDLLGLGMLAAIEHALEIRTRRGKPVDLAQIPKDDPAVFDLLCRADTIGTFQVESRAQMATLPIMRPATFYDLAIEVAIIRPGPIVGDLVHPYLNRRNGREAIDYIQPACKETLERTLGVPLFQEQVLRIAMDVAGFTGGEADELRKAMAFKRDDSRMEQVTAKLRLRMGERGIDPYVQEKVVDSIGSFALYGFPESHAISFALIAYSSCWLKVHHPAEFYTGLINNQPMGFYSVNTLIQDAKRHGIRLLPVSCVWSEEVTEVLDDSTLRLGLLRLKGLGSTTAARIVAEREVRPFASLEDFLSRARPTAKEKRLLAQGGALNDLPLVEHRREALWQVELPLFDDLLSTGNQTHLGIMPPMEMGERLSADYATQGASIGPHPMRLWRERSGTRQFQRAKDLQNLPSGFPVKVAGMAICRQRPGTAKGHCFISLEDETGIANLFIKKETFHTFRLVITSEPFLCAVGRLQRSEGDLPTVYVTSISPLADVDREHATKSHDFH
ncbi:error-prone DNA polymerase [Luteolibacter yonseiensis]|uniref:Error-prone DNA polymerase n=1 Tax=Luteolibacter yonseiensis TaxID=1144680 RepID=A0A934R8W2_9BACT|nr:error-prone DNA polymerase [Luteolibacter yonseiensis]MBK1817360.1 error-prone DNA polymerase [Luteolibacter yonseiensis]